MSEKAAEKPPKKVKKPREKGRVGKAADGFAGAWKRWTRRVFKWVFVAVFSGVLISVFLVVALRFVNPYMTYYIVT